MTRKGNSAADPAERPPTFFGPFHWVLLALPAAALLMTPGFAHAGASAQSGSPPPIATQNSEYRLAGVMLVSDDRIGFLEVPAGGQVLVRQGSVVDGGKVTVFNDREVRIVFPTRTVVLELQAGAGEPMNPAPTGVVASQEDIGNIMVRQIDADQMSAAIKTIKEPAPKATGSTKRTDGKAELTRRFAAVAHLPPDARILAVNEQPVTSAAQAIDIVEKSLEVGQGITLTLAARPGEPQGRVYLSLQRD